jgi:hypothetical protein
MFDSLATARNSLDEIASGFDPRALSPEAALRVVDQLGSIRRVVDGMLGKTAKRVSETYAGSGTAAGTIARILGVGTGEVRSSIETATKLEGLPATDAAVREGSLSAREAQLIADAATLNPAAERELLEAAQRGVVPLRDACVAARAAVEDPKGRGKRQHRERQFRMWTNADGMLAGRFAYEPEIGGLLKAAIDAQVKKIFREHKSNDHEPLEAYAADAVASFVLGTEIAKGVDAVVHIVVDHGVLVRGGTADGEVCEIPGVGPVDVGWVKELLGSAFLTVVIRKGKDILSVAHLGRHVPAEVMTALIVSGRECDIDGCHQRGYLERDHVHDHAKGGTTSYMNLCWLCYRHHRLKSGGWQLSKPDPQTRKRKLRQPPARAA